MKPLFCFRPAPALLFAAIAFFSAGCASYPLNVDSISRSKLSPDQSVSYRLHSQNPAVAEDTLRYKEAAQHIKTALSGRGLWEAPDAVNPDLIVELDFGIDPPHAVYESFERPVYAGARAIAGQTASVESESGEPRRSDSDTDASGGNRLAGFNSWTRQAIVSEKHLSVTCRVNRPVVANEPPTDLWRVSVSLEDASRDLRECLPVLASAVMTQIGTATDGVTLQSIAKSDNAIAFVKKGM